MIEKKFSKKLDYFNSAILDKCPKCNKTVYALEEIRICDKSFHKACLRCKSCNKLLDKSNFYELENGFYCKSCHGKKQMESLYFDKIKPIVEKQVSEEASSSSYKYLLKKSITTEVANSEKINPTSRRSSAHSTASRPTSRNSSRPTSSQDFNDDSESNLNLKSLKDLLKPVSTKGKTKVVEKKR